MADETATVAVDQAPEAIPETAGDTNTASQPAEQTAQAPDQPVASADEPLLSAEEFSKHANDPVALNKALQKAFTQKTQKLSEAKRMYEAYQGNPEGFARAVAQRHGLSIAAPAPAPAEVDMLASALEPVLGRDGAATVKQAFTKIVEQTVQPLYAKAALSESQAVLDGFRAKHSDFAEVEPVMAQWGAELFGGAIPATSDQNKVLDALYKLATYDRKSAAQTKAVVDRINAAVASAEPQTQGVAPNRVAPSVPAYKSASEGFDAAIAAAKRGEAWR